MKKIICGVLLITSITSYASENTMENQIESMIQKIESKKTSPEMEEKIHSSIAQYREIKDREPEVIENFTESINNLNNQIKNSSEVKEFIKSVKKECTGKNDKSEACKSTQLKFKNYLSDQIRNAKSKFMYVKFDGVNYYPETFFLLYGENNRENNPMTTVGLGLQFSRSLFSMTICTLPTKRGGNYGVVASAVAGLGVSTGIFVGSNGLCYDFSVNYGIGAYAGIGFLSVDDNQWQMVGSAKDWQCSFPATRLDCLLD